MRKTRTRRRLLPAAALAAAAALASVAWAAYKPDADARPTPPLSGRFTSLANPTSGTAKLVTLARGERRVILEYFETVRAPDLYVYLVPRQTAGGDIAGGVNLGRLRAGSGDESYPIPETVEIGERASVVVWCSSCSRPHGQATLQPA